MNVDPAQTRPAPAATAAPSDMPRDIASAYIASGTRIASWVIVSALVYRLLGPAEFAMLALVRGTIGLLNYTSLGLAPAMIHKGAGGSDAAQQAAGKDLLGRLYSSGLVVAIWSGIAGILLTVAYSAAFVRLYHVPSRLMGQMSAVVLFLGLGVVLRLVSDAPGAVLQVRNHIALDNLLIASGDGAWVVLTAASILALPRLRSEYGLTLTAISYAVSGLIALLGRFGAAANETGITKPHGNLVDRSLIWSLLAFGLLITLAQLADYLYAPTDFILINRLLSPIDVANYAPAVQIDSGLLLLVGGLSAVLLPKAALAHARGSAQTVRRYYLSGTVASAALLAGAAVGIWFFSSWIFRIWLGNSMPATRAILPLVLVHTVIGGSSAVGRSILLGIGRVRPFTIAVLIAGAVNVACSFAFVRYLHWGLRGIVLGTIVAVVGRCAIWMPWYVLRAVGQTSTTKFPSIPPAAA